jgi:hypothetical protein
VKRFVKNSEGHRTEHTGIKVWYVLCGTKGKKVEWAWLVGPVSGTSDALVVVDARGHVGHAGKDGAFFTREAAVDNWRYHSKAEEAEHLKLIKIIAEGMIKSAEEAETKLRPTKPWQDL